MLQNLHVESCVDSLTLRCEFVVHNSMAIKKKTINMTLIFDLLFSDFFGLSESFCFHSLLCNFSSMSCSWIHDSSPVMTLSKNSSLSSEVFQSMQHSFHRNFCSGVSSFGADFFHFHMFCQNRVNGRLSQTKFFYYHSNSQSAVNEHEITHTIDVLITT